MRHIIRHVRFPWCFTDAAGNDVECVLSGTCTPAEPARRTADPYDSYPGSDAEFDLGNAYCASREITDAEFEELAADDAVWERAFEEAEGYERDYEKPREAEFLRETVCFEEPEALLECAY